MLIFTTIPTSALSLCRKLSVGREQGGLDTVKPYVDEFVRFAQSSPDLKFYVTPIGRGIAGFTPKEMAPLFADALRVENVILPVVFVREMDR